MAMQATAVRFAPEEKAWIQSYADFVGKSFSDVVRGAALELVEDAADMQAYNEALAEDDGTRYSFEEIAAELAQAEGTR